MEKLFISVRIYGKFHILLRFPCSCRVHWSRIKSEFTQQFVHFFYIHLELLPTNAFSLQFCMRDILEDNAIFLEIIKCTRQLIMIFNDLFLPFFTTTHIVHSTFFFREGTDKNGLGNAFSDKCSLSWKLLKWKLKIAPLALFYETQAPTAVVYCVCVVVGASRSDTTGKKLCEHKIELFQYASSAVECFFVQTNLNLDDVSHGWPLFPLFID